MTSRRSMLKWIPASRVGGWAGLFGKAAAAPVGDAKAPAGAKPIGLQCEYDCAPNSGGTVDSYSSVYTYHADGRVLSETRTGGQAVYYNYSHAR